MPLDTKKLRDVYATLQKGGYEQDYTTFLNGFTGNDHYENRKKVYDLLSANGAQIGGSYEEFMQKMQVAPQQANKNTAASVVSSSPEQQKKDQPLTPAQRQSMIYGVQQMQQQTQAMIANTNEFMKNMKQYGAGLGFGQTKKGGYKYNPRTKKLEQTYLTPTGNRYSSKALADAESFRYRKAASEPLGLNMNDQQIDAEQKPANAAVAALWKEAEAKYAADRNKNAEDVYGGSPWLNGGREMHMVNAGLNSHKNEVSRLTRFDLQKMMDNAWGRVGKQMTASCYAQLKRQYPTATEQQLQNSASAMARRLSDNAVYKYAVAKNTPKSTLDFFVKTAADMNLLRTITKGLARSEAGTTGDMAAYEQAMSDYGKNHRWAQIGGTVTGMMFDPTTYISGGIGSFGGKMALNVGGRIVAKKAATNVGARLFGNTLAGRVVAGSVGGGLNFGTYEGIKEGESQWLHGGHINQETGENEGYSAGDVLKSSLHGTLLGSVTGTVSPLLGNVADKWVKATSNTAGKVGIRAGELATSTVAEGTIFSIPEWINSDGDAMDVWTDNMSMMLGFKAQHMVKSAPRVIAGLRPIEDPRTMQERNHNRMSFLERLRTQLDASPRDMAFTKEEREELQKYGYGDLASLFTRTPKRKPSKPQRKPQSTDGKVMYLDIPEAEVEDLGNKAREQWLKQHPEFDGYEAMERLMQDPNVSQSARAKAYYILTGRQLPMGTVTGYTTETDDNGNIFVKSVTADGEVVTSRRFADEASAKKEQEKIMRQAELNSVDVGERYTEAKADNKVFEAAVEAVAPGADPETVKRNYQAAKQGDKDAIANYGQMVDAIDKFMEENKGMADTERPEAIRAAIKEETGVDVDEAIKKEPSKRTEPEKAAVQDYIERLFPEQKAENEQPMSDDEAGASAIYDQARLLWDKVEKGDADAKAEIDAIALRMHEAYKECEDAFGADAEMRMAEMEDNPWSLANDPELTDDQRYAVLYYINAKAAMDGVQDASNDALENKRMEVAANVERHTHKDMGIIQPATMKVNDKPVYVVKGNVVMLPDGSGIDVRNSDQSFVICDAESGEYKFASPDQLLSLGEAIDPQTELDEAYANIQAEHEAVLGVPENGENVPFSTESVPQLTDDQLQQYAQSAFNEATKSNGVTIPQEQAEQLQQHNQQMLEQKQQRKEEEANRQPTALERVPISEETGEPMFEKAESETALDALNEITGGNDENTTAIVRAQVEQATKALEALKKKEPTKKAPFLKGSPMAMVKAQQEAEANYNTAMEEYNAQVAAAEENLNAWSRIDSIMNERKRAISEQQEAERKASEEKLHAEAVAERKRIAEVAEPGGGSQGGEQTENAVRGSEETSAENLGGNQADGIQEKLTEEEADAMLDRMKSIADPMPEVELTPENWMNTFGLSNKIDTPIGEVKMGESQYAKLMEKKRSKEFGMVVGTITDPDVVFIEPSSAKDGQVTERAYSYVFVKTFKKEDENVRYYSSVTVSIDGMEISVSSHYINSNKAKKKLLELNRRYTKTALISNSSDGRLAEQQDAVPDLLPTQENNAVSDLPFPKDGVSVGEDTNKQLSLQGNEGKIVGGEGETSLSAKIDAASADVNTDPTEAQKEAGNYKKGHVHVGSFDITIEQPQGSVRKGTDADGKQWESKMHNTYGYFRGTKGVDGDHIDVFLSNDIDGWNRQTVFVVDQYNPDGSFDEHKVMLGFNNAEEAKMDYLANYEKGWENGRRIDVSAVNLADFEKWIASSHRKTKPFAEYVVVKKETVGKSGNISDEEIENAAFALGLHGENQTLMRLELDNTPERARQILDRAKKWNEKNAASPTTLSKDETTYTITPSTYTNKKGKTSNVSLLTFDHDLTADQERAVKEFAKERTGEGRFAPARGWKDRESGGWMFRSEEDARKAAEMVGDEEAVADNQPMTAQELRDAVEPKKPTASKKTAAKKPANRVEVADVEEQKPSEPTKAEQPKQDGEKKLVITDEMKHDEDILRELLGIGDEELDGGIKFRDPDAMTSQQRRFVYNAGVNYSLGYIDQGFVKFPEFAKAMVSRLGYKIKPWLKSFYEGAKRIPGYDQTMFSPTEEVDAFDVENFDKPNKDVMAQANMIVEEGKAQVAAEKANNELKATRNEQRKETEKQTAANTDAVAAEAKSVASEATALAETSSDEQELNEASDRVDEALDNVNDQLALLGYYEADHVEKDFNEAYGYMRNAEKKAVKDAANLASQLIDDLGFDRFEATHGEADKKGKRKTKPLAVANIAPAGGYVTMHLPLTEGRELYVNIKLVTSAGKGITNFGGDNLEVTHIMFRVDHPEGTGNDRYGRNVWVGKDVTYSELLDKVKREAYKYIPKRTEVTDGEYEIGDKVQYSPDGGRTWTDAVVVQPNDEGGIRIDTGLAPVMWVNAHPDQLRHKPSESAEPKHEAVGDFYEDGINEDAVAELPEDTAIQLHVVDILNPGMTDHSMKSKIESLNTLLPKISDKKLSELDKEYGDDKDMGTHIKAEVARRAKDGGVQPTSSDKPADKPKPASKKKATKKVKPEQPVGDLFTGMLDEEPETKVEARNDGNTDIHRTFANTVKNDMLASLDNGTKPYRGILDLRKRAKELGMDVDDEGRSDILLQELVEDGLVRAAREVTERIGSGNKESYDLICKLYEMQPTISARSSNRIKMQQYSTPLPMAWNADRFAMYGKDGGLVLEPTAGNGMLVFGVPAKQVHANELDETRLANLREQGFVEVTQQDATEPFEGGKKYDAVISNPPFGKREAAEYDGKMIGGLDPQITLNALASMKDDGRAAIIIGGNMEYAANGGIKNMKSFFTYLYDHYNVKGVVDMDGKLYAKQGTTFPTRMILINGRRSEEARAQSAVYPPVKSKAVRKAESFEDLYDIIEEITNSTENTNGTEILRSQQGQLDSVGNKPSGRTDREGHNEQPRKNDEAGHRKPRAGSKPANAANGSQPVLSGERGAAAGDGKARSKPTGNTEGGTGGNTEHIVQRVGTERVPTDGVGLAPTVHAEPKKRELTDEKSAYRPHNTAYSLKSVAPAAMVEAMDNVLAQIEKEHGSIDNFVTKELGYDSVDDAHHALAAEQMDSVAMAVYQMKHGQALIIGDQTGVGKGRQMAALIRWAVKRGEKPIFITQKADLFSDIYRDLVDVGSGDLVPFIFNSDGAMVDSNGKTVHKPMSQKEQAKVFASGSLPDEYDFAVLTYSQVNTGDDISQKEFKEAAKQSGARTKKSKSEGKPTPKATFLRAIAKDNYLFLDESHTAAGTSNTGAYLQSILRIARAATFASATFAKRPDTMPLYAIRTAMSQANVEPNKMISIIEKGGVTLQEIMSRELTNAGQMVRRERDMSDVRTDWKTIDDAETVKRARENYDKTIAAFNAIIKFQEDYVKPMIDGLDQELAIMAENAGVKRGTEKMGVDNVPFASKTYNYTKQLMLALKVDAIADEVEKEINAGRHPVIALESTMENSIKDYAAGETIDEPTFSASLLKGLDSVMQYTIKDENGNEQHLRYSPSELGKVGEKAYYELQNLIRESTSDIFISPLDAIIDRLHEKGYKVGELTGRNMYVDHDEDGKAVVKRRTDKDKKRMQREFNNGELDVLILNKSASTGISLHASEKFSDQRQRSMIIAQPLSDINDYMQMIGRIDRTGQVHRGYYINLGLPVPAENRFLMMLSTKLKSLNANTTTSQDSESNEVDAPDLLNKYGSQVVVEYLRDNPEIYEKMGAPLKKSGIGGGKVMTKDLDEYKAQEDDARKITGYVALLSTKEQEDFYDDVVRRYNELIKYLNDTGNNDLKITVMPLRAKTLEKRVSSAGIAPNGNNPFAQNSYVEKVEMDVLRKPMKADEVRKTIEQVNKGKSPEDYMSHVVATINAEDAARLAAESTRYEKDQQRAQESIAKQAEKINAQKKRTVEEKASAIATFTEETNANTEAKHKQYVERIKVNSRMLKHSLNQFEVGKSYLVPDNLESQMFDFAAPAIFCGYKTKDSKITASTTLAVFATLDGRRRVEVKLSQLGALQSIDKMTNDNWDSARSTTLDNWDSQIPTETRKEGYIMTGNILQAIADTQDERGGYPGQLISYTDINGNVHDGILMPDKWNSTMLKSSGVSLISRMQQIKNYELVKSNDGNVEITGSAWAHTYYLTVPKTKKDGAKFFENETLLRAAGGNFYPYHGKLRADIAEKDIETVVKELSKLGVKVKDSNPSMDDGKKFRLLDDDDPKAMELESLPDSELVPVYRNVQAFEDDALGSPMAFTDAETGERRTLDGGKWNYSNPPKIHLTDEQQRQLDELNKNGYIMVNGKKSTELQINEGLKFVKPKTKEAQLQYFLKKNPEDKGLWAAYDPYDHAIETPLNTQFGEAYKRPNLVVVRSLIPKSEIDEPFHADYALLPTGAHQWNNGRTLYLSRWSKIDKVLTREEEAKMIDEYWKKHPGKREALKSHRDYNRFVPQVRRELEKMGYRFELDGKELTPEESRALDEQNLESRDVIPGREGQLPFISNEDIARINAKMAGTWVGEPKEAMENAMTARVNELSERLHTPVRIIRTDEEVAALPSARQRRMKGSFNPMTGEVTIVVPNNANMADIENTFVHEVVGHDGLRVLFPDEAKLNNALDELYRVSKDEIRGTIDRMAQKMYDAEVDRIREKKRKEHEKRGEDVNASYYADMAEAHAEANKKREQFKRDATEEYGADLAGRIGEKGFEKMSAEELTFWGKLKAMLQKALQKLLDGLKIPSKRKWGDKDWAFVLHEAYKRKKNGGKPTVFDAADTEVMRRKTGFGETKFSDGKREQQTANERFNNELTRYQNGEMDKNEILHLGRPQGVMRAFLPNLPIVMRQRVIKKGSEKKHDVDVSAIMNMPQHLSLPIFVFQRSEDTIGVLTDMRDRNGKNVCVAIELNGQIQQGAEYLEVNDVRSFHGREFKNIVEPIANNNTLKWVDKEKGLAYLSSASQPVQQEKDKKVLNDATKVVKGFVNPKISDENVADEGIMFRDGDMGLDETITQMKVAASQANADNWQAKQEAMKAIGGNLNKLRQAMARQREYDLSTVKSITDLAKVLLDNGLLDDLSKYETKRILSAVNTAHGKQDTSNQVTKVMDIMVDNQLRMGANMLGKLLSIRGSRVDARGIEVQGRLDPDGQTIAGVVRKATSLPKADIEERMADALNRMGSDDQAVSDEAALEYSGLLLARQYAEDITDSKSEEKALRDSIKQAKEDLDAGTMDKEAYLEYVAATNDAIRQNKIERAEAYRSIVEQVGGVLGGSVERAKAWREAEKQRVEAIHHNANSDMVGRPTDEHHKESKVQKIANNSIVRFVLAPLGTFDQMLRMFGKKSVNGEGYLWNRYMRGWVEATEKEYTGYQKALKTLDEKVSEVFDKKMKWGDLFSMERNMPKATVTFWDGGAKKAHELTQGNLLYIYMVDKMADGRMKLRRMGITEEDVENIKEFVDPHFLELADWMQEEFLVQKRNEYNEVHKRMFGASMAAIENYFPLKILANARIEEVDVADDTTDTALPATSTGSIIKRRRNNLALDVMGADAFSVILDHVQQMERWAAFAEFNRDLNTLLSYKHFRNQVMNMSSVYGGGKTLWTNFRNVCSMAAGAYRPPIAQLDKAAVNIAKGVTAAKVSFRLFTALKQFLSMPAYLSDSNPIYLAANIANPIGAWKWSMDNLPLFEKRWKSRMAGDPRLMKSEMDWKMWRSHVVEIASRIGMSPNAFVDALTVAIGAHSMYQTKKKKYLRYGYDDETAEKRAKQDATILFNQTQQSSESAFLSTMQVDRSWLSVLFTIFRNSPMSYTRQLYDAIRNIRHRFEPGFKAMSEEYMAKQMRRDGIDPDKANSNAKSEYRRSLLRDLARVGVFGFALQMAWNLGAYLPYLIAGDDKDEKSKMWDDVMNHTMFGSFEGLTGGDVMSSAGQMALNGEANWSYLAKDMPLASDLATILKKMPKDKVAAMNDVVNLLVQSGVGVNPQSLTDAVVAIMDYCGDDANTSRECALLITRIINCPQSQIDKIYFDELNATAAEAQGMTIAEIAERYADYKIHRNAPLTGWAYSEEARDSVKTAMQNRALTQAKEKLNSRMETEETKQLLSDYDAVAKQESELSKIKKTDHAAYREGMKQLRQNTDMRQHGRLKRYKHDMKQLTEKYLRSKDAAERDSIVKVMLSTREKMLEDIGRLKQQ